MRMRRTRPADGLRAAQRLLEREVLAVVRAVVVAPHLQADLDGFLELFEAVLQRGERHTEPPVLALVPGGTDAQLGPAARQHVEGGDRLGQQPRVAIRHARDEQAQPQALGAAGDEAERGVALEHRVFGRCHPVHLEEVVHERHRPHADGFGTLGEVADTGADAIVATGPVESGDVQIEFHRSRG